MMIFFILLLSKITNGQEFSFPIYFEDAVGNKDTIILGYDINATDSIDIIFGEVNILGQPLHSEFDVRSTDENGFFTTNGSFHTKKQIIKNSCNYQSYFLPVIKIDIKCKHWPVTAKWDKTLFYDTCRNESVITSITPGGWWDVGSYSNLDRVILNQTNQVTFTRNYENNLGGYSSYLNNSGDSISIFWVGLDDKIISTNIPKINPQKSMIKFYKEGNILIIENAENNQIENIQIIDLTGQVLIQDKTHKKIDIINLRQGLYLCKIITVDKQIMTYKFIK